MLLGDLEEEKSRDTGIPFLSKPFLLIPSRRSAGPALRPRRRRRPGGASWSRPGDQGCPARSPW